MEKSSSTSTYFQPERKCNHYTLGLTLLFTTAYVFGIMVPIIIVFWAWMAKHVRKQERRLKACLLGINWLMERADTKPSTYVHALIEDALRDD